MTGCSSPTDGGSRVLPVGTYAYEFEGSYGVRNYRFEGTFTITTSDRDEVTGTWNVQTLAGTGAEGFEPEIELGFWNTDAYVLSATYDDPRIETGLLNHRVWMRSGSPECVSVAWLIYFGGQQGSLTPIVERCEIRPL